MKWKFWQEEEDLKNTIHNEKYVPAEILDGKYKNTDIQGTLPKVYRKDGYLVKEYLCGCKFENKIDSFGFSNHWCDDHAEKHSWNTSKDTTKAGGSE